MTRLTSLLLVGAMLFGQSGADPALSVYRDWSRRNPSTSDEAGREAHNQKLLAATAEWTEKWPDSKVAWSERRAALQGLRSDSGSEWKATGEALIRLSPPHTQDTAVARDWIAANVLLEPAVALLQEHLAWHKKGLAAPNAGRGNLAEAVAQANYAIEPFSALELLASAQIKMKSDAKATLAELRRFLENEFRGNVDPDPFDTIPDHQARLWSLSGDLAAAEGRKLDAFGFYSRVSGDPYMQREYPQSFVAQSRALWTELGGSDAAWAAWSKPSPLPAELNRIPPYLPLFPWLAVHFELPPLDNGLLGSAGRKPVSWQGKTTFVTVWSTWCAPCWNELPGLQRVADALKLRSDWQVISISVDDDESKVVSFMREKGYSFPVVVNRGYVDRIYPGAFPGQRWVVDASGAIRLWTIPWGVMNQDQAFADVALEKLGRVASAGGR